MGRRKQFYVCLFETTYPGKGTVKPGTIVAGVSFEIPSGTMVDPNGYYLLWEEDFPAFFGCEPEGDNLYLLNSDGVRVDQMGWWIGSESDSSWSAVPDGDRLVFEGYDLASCPDFERTVPTPQGVGVPESNSAFEVTSFRLGPVYPNPFNASTRIYYSLTSRSEVSLVVYDVLGREVATLVNGELGSGFHSVVWQADDVASGTYFAVLTAGNDVRTIRMTLVK